MKSEQYKQTSENQDLKLKVTNRITEKLWELKENITRIKIWKNSISNTILALILLVNIWYVVYINVENPQSVIASQIKKLDDKRKTYISWAYDKIESINSEILDYKDKLKKLEYKRSNYYLCKDINTNSIWTINAPIDCDKFTPENSDVNTKTKNDAKKSNVKS